MVLARIWWTVCWMKARESLAPLLAACVVESFLLIAVLIFRVDRQEAKRPIKTTILTIRSSIYLFFSGRTKPARASFGRCQHSHFGDGGPFYFLYNHLGNAVARLYDLGRCRKI